MDGVVGESLVDGSSVSPVNIPSGVLLVGGVGSGGGGNISETIGIAKYLVSTSQYD